MRHARRFFATILGIAILWITTTSTTAYALRPDPQIGEVLPPSPPPTDPGTPLWQYLLVAAVAALLTVAVVGLIASLRQSRPAGSSMSRA